ncbi:hypothetical protein T492DRAFT_1091433 [Pavlovales sp. CCMP2436]|nr:hypothetical protein T492DRAFT_1091433 [Pavlovales sp. CCMP2436]|mmetsp:Transcript_2425/g.6306  ORF Transcript_2425/g.6306 Transcript_2425/m.6306 type:complete len:327 (+) Transcript_2425:172-1152(+)
MLAGAEEGWRDEVRARVSGLLRREPVPPAELLEHCCAILDEAMRTQEPVAAGGGDHAPPMRFRRLDDEEDKPAKPTEEVDYGMSLPLRSLQPGYPRYDARSQSLVDQYARAQSAQPAPVNARQIQIDTLCKAMENARPSDHARRQGTKIGGGFSTTTPLDQTRYKRITLTPVAVAAWAMMKTLVPELAGAQQLTIHNFPALGGGAGKDAVQKREGWTKTDEAGLKKTAEERPKSFAEPVQVSLSFVTPASAKPAYRKVTLATGIANLLKDSEGELFYDYHPDAFTRTAAALRAGDGEPGGNIIQRRLEAQEAERSARIGDKESWRY